MSKKKLTLSVEERLSRRAKAIAEERGTSVSRLVETFFAALGDGSDAKPAVKRDADEEASGEANAGEGTEERHLEKHELSEWARRWRGAFKEPGRSYPDDPSWEKQLLAEEIDEKHA